MGSESRLFYEMTHYYSIARMPPEGSLDLKLLRGFPEEMKWVKKHKSMLGFWTIHHPHFPTALLVTFARHPDVGLRAAVPLHRGVGTDLLTELGSDPSPHVRLAVACNAKTPLSVLDLLKHDPNSNVRMAATHTSQIAES
ncbi:MAG: hypothetical protein RBG13Loki_2586 [Promethearchaeota archaeon CR_4]|nr:MAG: hypothetical protein RBG13Loki_2586 [Candidatus Lokiarchaeota archaeon CR_4]